MKELSEKLWSLCTAIRKLAEQCKSDGRLAKKPRQYSKPSVKGFSYDEGKVRYKSSSNTEVVRDEWPGLDIEIVNKNTIRELPEYNAATPLLAKQYNMDERKAKGSLSAFTRIVLRDALADAEDETTVARISTFLNNLSGGAVRWRVNVNLNGIWLQNERCQISETLAIRRTEVSDLEVEEWSEMRMLNDFSIFEDIPSAILELDYRAREQVEVQRELEFLLDCLRLFGLGSVLSGATTIMPESILMVGGTSRVLSTEFAAHYRYGISQANAEAIETLMKGLRRSFDISVTWPRPRSEPVAIALQRYKDALLVRSSTDRRITTAITALEALYLKPKERSELSHRLAQRLAKVLGLFGVTPLIAYGQVHKAYGIRSDYVHGAKLEIEDKKAIIELTRNVMNYLRLSLLLYLHLPDSVGKDGFIPIVDKALLDRAGDDELRALMPAGVATWQSVSKPDD